ncbi:HlyD family secretion protein [Desmonostoc muscorum LEGE 12446]|uniref:HlyD family efflux transporter periplasmic adaptor subunit n=1 Tax=Desmonostoc muscorum LEGE 12446 TaxID=1828758 RepID=A0A8J7AD18_DESMC|nr:HlyD family efflux transporter periplasmic adaptor subunit [Desmonostoc muscorum]MCF2152112.1 HlyD family secretion protein [Desmonostoc muscorum LEGE 12446]
MTNTLNEKKTQTQENYISKQRDDWSNITQELLDSLPRVWTRGLLYFLVIFVSIVLPWAMLSKVDETGTARGRIEPQGKTVRLDAPVSGTVTKIQVKEGDFVKAGQTLLELDSELVGAELKQQKNKLEGQQNRLHQLSLLLNQLQFALEIQQQQNQSQALEKQAQVKQIKQKLDSLNSAYNLQKEEKIAQVNQAKKTLEHSQTTANLDQIRLGTAQKELNRYQNALKEEIVSEIQLVEREDFVQERIRILEQTKSDLEQAKLRLGEQKSSYARTLKQANSDIQQAQLQLKEQENSYQSLLRSGKLAKLKIQEQFKNLETEMTTLKAEIAQSQNLIKSLEFQLNQRIVKANIEGKIFQLSINRPGAVVQPGNAIAEIAPKGTALILRAKIESGESGSLQKGMSVKIKFDAYPFQEYGIVEGRLIKISPTTYEMEVAGGKTLVYDLDIELNRTCIQTQKDCINLRPGETATAEVIVRQRRLIDFVLDPFKKLEKEGFRL